MTPEQVAVVKTCHKIGRVLVDVCVKAEFPYVRRWWNRSQEDVAKELEREIKDFDDFLRYHRSQDMIRLDVERTYEDQCSVCKERWETYVEDGKKWCASCGAAVEEA